MAKPAIKILVDRSGSMAGMPNASQAIADFIKERRAVGEVWVSLSEFDDQYNVVYPFQSITNIPEYKLEPRGMTALNDAIAKSVKEIEEFKPGKPRDRYLVIMTDGFENASVEHTRETIKKLLEDKQAQGLKVIYLGANQDAVQVAALYAIPAQAAMTFTRGGLKSATTDAAWATASPITYSIGFSDKSRLAAVADDGESDSS